MLFRKTLNSWQLSAHRSEGDSCPALGRRLMEKAGEVWVATQGGLWEQPCCPRCRWLRLPESSCRHLTPSPAAKNEKHIPAVGAARTGSGQSALLCLLVEGTVSRARGLELGLAGALAPCLGSKRLPALGVGLGGGRALTRRSGGGADGRTEPGRVAPHFSVASPNPAPTLGAC